MTMKAEILQEQGTGADPDGTNVPWTAVEFEAALHDRGRAYHIHHPFNRLLNEGRAGREQVRGWVANRWYYQIAIPVKDAAVLANCPDREVRRGWVQRILDHDGFTLNGVVDAGGLEAWLRLADAVGLERDEVIDLRHVAPGVRFAVDAYVNFARRAPWQEAVCSSLTELFAPEIHRRRLEHWPQHYRWIEPEGLHYFRSRVGRAARDVEQGLALTLAHFTTRAAQRRALEVLQFKLDVLWAMNDAMASKYGLDAAAANDGPDAAASIDKLHATASTHGPDEAAA